MVALSTCDTEKWFTLKKWLDSTPSSASELQNATSHRNRNNARDHNVSAERVVQRLRQRQRRLTVEQVTDMIVKFEAGTTVCQLAAEFGCHRTTVADYLTRVGEKIRL